MRMRNWTGITILVVLSAATLVVLSPNSSTDTNAVAVESSTDAPGTAGLRAYLDPETGELAVGVAPLGSIELDAEMQDALRHDDEGLVVVQHVDGSVSMDLQGRYQSVSTVRIDENGKIVICSDNAANAERSLSETTSHTATLEVK